MSPMSDRSSFAYSSNSFLPNEGHPVVPVGAVGFGLGSEVAEVRKARFCSCLGHAPSQSSISSSSWIRYSTSRLVRAVRLLEYLYS